MYPPEQANAFYMGFHAWLEQEFPRLLLTDAQDDALRALGHTRLYRAGRNTGKRSLMELIVAYHAATDPAAPIYEAHGPTPDGYAGVRLVGGHSHLWGPPSDSDNPPAYTPKED